MAVSPEQIVIGCRCGIPLLIAGPAAGPGTRCSPWRTPAIPRSVRSMTPAEPSCAPIPLDGQGVELSALERSGAKALHISPNHQYPTGLVTPIVRRAGASGAGRRIPAPPSLRTITTVSSATPAAPSHSAKHRRPGAGHLPEHLFPDHFPLYASWLSGAAAPLLERYRRSWASMPVRSLRWSSTF